jgi:uncharacterized protein (DUF362 family)
MAAAPFINILTVFGEQRPRDLVSLSSAYADLPFLTDSIRQLTKEHLNSSSIRGKKVLLKPNWVRHPVCPDDEFALCTNQNFILALLDLVLSHEPARVVIGDAPVQGCKWQQLLSPEFYESVENRAWSSGIPIQIKDFRRVVFDSDANNLQQAKDNLEEFVIFDVGERSFLEPVTHPSENRFRVTVYDPDRFLQSHRPGVHKYCITRELFEADLVISVPKVKTHQKAGITAALKNIVGINGDKDFLPHHRIGGDGRGGDCYPGNSKLRYLAELCYDKGNRQRGKWQYKFWIRLASTIWKLSLPTQTDQIAAGWYGNDTTWRMVMDLNLILNFGTIHGTIADVPQRVMYSLCDGIIGGQGDGPLDPSPLSLGAITFSNNSALNDICCAELMRMDVTRIPLLVAASKVLIAAASEIRLNGKPASLNELRSAGIDTEMPPGWTDYQRKAPIVDYDQLMVSQYQSKR